MMNISENVAFVFAIFDQAPALTVSPPENGAGYPKCHNSVFIPGQIGVVPPVMFLRQMPVLTNNGRAA